jgi:hypothetical protein
MQTFWEYTNKNQERYSIGLYHGEESNHVVIYSDRSIIKIDFNVIQPKSYNFMLDDELFCLNIGIQNNSNSYSLTNISSNIIMPHNSQNSKKYNRNDLIIITLIATFALSFFILMFLILK